LQSTAHAPTVNTPDAFLQHSTSLIHIRDWHLDICVQVLGVQRMSDIVQFEQQRNVLGVACAVNSIGPAMNLVVLNMRLVVLYKHRPKIILDTSLFST